MQNIALRSALTIFLATACTATPAVAEVTVFKAEYQAGVLTVRGETTKPHQRITLDGRFAERTNRFGEFAFRIRYLPNDCMVRLRAGSEVRPAFVKGCAATNALMPEHPPYRRGL